jgi:iron-sulfur cluster repair protein YtfE (RIC family)
MKTIAEQTAAELGGRASVLSRQKRDHLVLRRLLAELAACPPNQADHLLLHLYRLVFPHAFAEEAVLWPLIRRVLPDGHEHTLRVEQEHQQINQLVVRLESLPRSSRQWHDTLHQTTAAAAAGRR